MIIIKPLGGPRNKGFKICSQTVMLEAHAALTRGICYPVDLTAVDTNLAWYKTANKELVAEHGGLYVIPKEDVAAGNVQKMAFSGEANAISGEAFAVGALLTLNANGQMIDTVAPNDRFIAIAVEAATASAQEVKVEFIGGGSFGQDIGT